MLKRLHKIAFIICTICFLGLSSWAHTDVNTAALKNITAEQMNFVSQDVKVDDLDIEPINTKKVKDGVVPNTKQEGKKVLQLFLKTMLAVAISAILLNVILIFVKRFYGSAFVSQDYDDYEELDLTTPNTKQDALKAFLNRTK